MDKDKLYIEHIVQAIGKIGQYIDGITFEYFKEDSLIQDGVVRELEIVGEAARQVSESTKQKYKKIPWHKISGMRNKLIHEYFGVDIEVVWKTATKDLKTLKENLEKTE